MKLSALVICIIGLSLISCRTTPDCISEKDRDLKIRWGEVFITQKVFDGYELDAEAKLYRNSGFTNIKGDDLKLLGNVDKELYCTLLLRIRDEFLKVQALNAPGDTSRYVEYIDPANNISVRALWNPRFKTYLSEGFRGIYDSLQIFTRINNP
jgi:hypothetical protein